jgi:hypothetical protein
VGCEQFGQYNAGLGQLGVAGEQAQLAAQTGEPGAADEVSRTMERACVPSP